MRLPLERLLCIVWAPHFKKDTEKLERGWVELPRCLEFRYYEDTLEDLGLVSSVKKRVKGIRVMVNRCLKGNYRVEAKSSQ